MFRRLKLFLRNSRRVHARQSDFATPCDALAVIDRFLAGAAPEYPLEWDDFISWKNKNPFIERIRCRIAETEPMFFSKEPAQMLRATEIVLLARNDLAAICGAPAKSA